MRATDSLASDGRSLDALKTGAARDPKGAVRQAASQFEALFMQMVLKSMRDSVPKSGMLEGTGADVYQGLLDTQFAQAMTGRPGGLGDQIARQLMRAMKFDDAAGGAAAPEVSAHGLAAQALARSTPGPSSGPGPAPGAGAGRGGSDAEDDGAGLPGGLQVAAAAAARAAAAAARGAVAVRRDPAGAMPMLGPSAAAPAAAAAAAPARDAQGAPAAFVGRMWGAAAAAQQATGVPAGFIVGQAALESGWGRHEIRLPDGRSAHNLFGIKAGAGWRGPTVESATTEYVDGKAVRSVERFRAYGSYQEAFADWARLMAGNPRYAGVLAAGGSVESFARNLQQAGYATDPQYASKLTRTITQALSLRRVST
jgi:flagellar protein FlgJ